MRIDGSLVREHERFVGSMRDGHDVDVGELGSALAPVRVRQDMMAADLAAGFDLPPFRYPPVKQRVVPGHAIATCRWLHVLEEGGEATDHSPFVERLGDVDE